MNCSVIQIRMLADVVFVSFCDDLTSDRELWKRAQAFMGRRLLGEIARR